MYTQYNNSKYNNNNLLNVPYKALTSKQAIKNNNNKKKITKSNIYHPCIKGNIRMKEPE